ncbi:hypothetical protein V8C35DRAFT_295966 [Trichoderma chlorosporum]
MLQDQSPQLLRYDAKLQRRVEATDDGLGLLTESPPKIGDRLRRTLWPVTEQSETTGVGSIARERCDLLSSTGKHLKGSERDGSVQDPEAEQKSWCWCASRARVFSLSWCLWADAGNSDQMFETSLRHTARRQPCIHPPTHIAYYLQLFFFFFSSWVFRKDGGKQPNPANGPRSRTSTGIAASNPLAGSAVPEHAGDTPPPH